MLKLNEGFPHVSSTNSGFDKYIVIFSTNTVGGIKYVLHLAQITFCDYLLSFESVESQTKNG